MSMVVKNNMSAISTLNTLNKNSSALSKSLQKVSSGMKINSAADDASGYAISERMRVQIRSLDQANANTQSGNSMMKVAEGAVSSTVDILKTLKEKVINAANDTNTDSDRQTIQKELNQSIDQIDDNANITFNGKYLVDGSKNKLGQETFTSMTNQGLAKGTTGDTLLTALANRNNESLEIALTDKVTISYVQGGKTYTSTLDVDKGDGSSISLKDVFQAAEDTNDGDQIFARKDNASYVAATVNATTGSAYSTALSNAVSTVSAAVSTYSTESSNIISNAISVAAKVSAYNAAGAVSAADKITVASSDYLGTTAATTSAAKASAYLKALEADGKFATMVADSTNYSGPNSAAISGYVSNFTSAYSTYVADAGVAVLSGSNVGVAASNDMVKTANEEDAVTVIAGVGGITGQISGLNISVTDSEGNVKKSVNAAFDGFTESVRALNKSDDNAITLQVGAKANQAIKVGLTDMRSEALGLKGSDGTKLNISTQTKANAAINVLDNALQKALDQQTTIGSIESRLNYTSSNLTTGSENVQASESTIRDADMAKEMTEYTKNNVLLQAAQSMLAQANQSSSSVLSLLQ
ncbi:flagellin [Selenomonas sp. AE3005]|uniref:flagellin N-terminal helical domain-containing protein n=1 Tax=Selenomonas sp. AE3005 TaxID=1485543 RepID=UPI0025CD6AA5|nr:flagellin [Selenomonas sp. AE3005]